MDNLQQYLGLGKTKHSSSVCILNKERAGDCEIYLTERLNRKKNSGSWPSLSLKEILPYLNEKDLLIAENRAVHKPEFIEELENQYFPFFEYLKKNNLEKFSRKFNPQIKFVNHHLCHAYAALALSPFEKSIIVVMDGAGNAIEEEPDTFEECTAYLQDRSNLKVILRRSVTFQRGVVETEWFGNRVGSLYEKASEYIFGNQYSSGKVMGLAPFGNPRKIEDRILFQKSLDIGKKFSGTSKLEWETTSDLDQYIQIAADVQQELENDYLKLFLELKKQHPEVENLILTGGCALNCTNNAKVLHSKFFKSIYVPPFPGDESIGFGAASFLKISNDSASWEPRKMENQNSYWGPLTSIPSEQAIEKCFPQNEYDVMHVDDIEGFTAELLFAGKIIAWFQERSECGPRALGNRSILVRPDKVGIRDYLNSKIKFRESFRPYGCSVPHEYADEYFEVTRGFNNPFMSFAVGVRQKWKNKLLEVTHIDGTSRMQTVQKSQNERFYNLLNKFGEKSGLFCLLNTSLNIMNEPIVENIEDAKKFLNTTDVDCLILGNYVIQRRKDVVS